MDKDISCLNFKGLFTYIEKRFGSAALHRLVDTALAGKTYLIENRHEPGCLEELSIAHLIDESNWISNELSLALLASIKTVVPGPRPEQDAGRGAILESLSGRDLFFCRIVGPAILVRRAAKVNARFNRTKTVSLASVDENGTSFVLAYRPGVKVTTDVCRWNLGIYEGIAKLSGARMVRVRETRCVTKGHPHCEFRVDWQKPGVLKRLYTSFLNLFTGELVAEYEKILGERDQLFQRLKTSEQQYRLLIENQTDMVVKLDLESRFLFVSPSYCRMAGKTESQLLGNSFMPLVHPGDRAGTEKTVEALLSPPHTAYAEHRTRDGKQWIAWSETAILDDRGRVMEILMAGRDITGQKQAEAALVRSEKRFREIIEDVSGIAILGVDENREVTFWNHASEQLYGYTRQEALGRRLEDLIIPEAMKERVKTLHRRWLESGEKIPPGERELRNKAGGPVPVFSSPALVRTGQGREMFCIDVDLGPMKEAQEALGMSEALFRLMAENTSALVSVHGADTRYIFASPSHKLFGYRPEDLVGRSAFTMVAPSEKGPLSRQLDEIKDQNLSSAVINFTLQDKGGQARDFRGSVDAVTGENGRFDGFICVAEDITELKKAQQQREEAQAQAAENRKLVLVGQVAGKLAHDFNNILGSILGNAELSLLDCTEAAAKKSFQLIVDQTIRGRNLTRNLVAFAKDQEPRQEFFRVNEKAELVLTLLKKDLEGIEVIRAYGQQVPDLLADPGMVEHALVNIVQNAIHATSLTDRPRITIRTHACQDRICIEVTDNGCGIPSGLLDRIYEPSFTLKGSQDHAGAYRQGIKGTGYGLANVKKYIEQHRGALTVTSREKRGTTVSIFLPVVEKELTARERAVAGQQNWHREKRILLVEDEKDIQDAQYRILTQSPCWHRVDAAGNGREATALFDKKDYDLVSLDYVLPGRENGMDVYRHIRSVNSEIPVLFISGNLEFIASIKALKRQDPNIEHLSKPCRNMEYLKSVNHLFSRAGKHQTEGLGLKNP